MQRLSAQFPVGPHAGRTSAHVVDFAGRKVGAIGASHVFQGHWWTSYYHFTPNALGKAQGLVEARAETQYVLWEKALGRIAH